MKLLYLIVLLFSSSVFAYVQVNPVRFFIKDAKFGHFTVRNTQSKPVSVEIDNKYFEMKPDGKMVQESKDAKDELKKILFTPKNFTLNPGEKQVVRFFIKDSIQTSELRTFAHLLTEIKENNEIKEQNSGQSMSLTARVALAIPVIYRPVTDKQNTSFLNEKLTQTGANCQLAVDWKNLTHSSYINFSALDEAGNELFKINGVSNYLKEYNWKLLIEKIDCKKIKKIQFYDVDNEVLIVSRDINQ